MPLACQVFTLAAAVHAFASALEAHSHQDSLRQMFTRPIILGVRSRFVTVIPKASYKLSETLSSLKQRKGPMLNPTSGHKMEMATVTSWLLLVHGIGKLLLFEFTSLSSLPFGDMTEIL